MHDRIHNKFKYDLSKNVSIRTREYIFWAFLDRNIYIQVEDLFAKTATTNFRYFRAWLYGCISDKYPLSYSAESP